MLATAPFGLGMVLVFLGIMNYLIDSYTIYAASVLAANSIIRSCFGAVSPLFTTYMYHNLGIHWASCIPAFLSLACVPFPFIFYRYGPAIRQKCKYAAEADAFMRSLTKKAYDQDHEPEKEIDVEPITNVDESKDETADSNEIARESASISSQSTLERTETVYDANPYDIDHVNTHNSAITQTSRRVKSRWNMFSFGHK